MGPEKTQRVQRKSEKKKGTKEGRLVRESKERNWRRDEKQMVRRREKL